MIKNKYKAKKAVVDGIVFDSRKEAKRYTELKKLEEMGALGTCLFRFSSN